MMRDDTRRIALSLLWAEAERLPPWSFVRVRDLMRDCPSIVETSDRVFEVEGRERLHDPLDIDVIEQDIWGKAEEEGYYVEHYSRRVFVLMKRIEPGRQILPAEIVRLHYVVESEDDFTRDLRVELNDNKVRLKRYVPKCEISRPAYNADRQAIARVLSESSASSWLPIYESEHDVANGEKWALHVVLDDGMALNSMGLNAWPNGYDALVEGLLGLFDGRGAI